jgi:hypothetical protein
MTDSPFYILSKKDEILVINAAEMIPADDGKPAYTLLIDMADGRWFLLNFVTDSATQAARLLHETRKEGSIELSDWTDVSFLRSRLSLNTGKALCLGSRTVMRGSHRPMHPDDEELSVLLEGDEARVMSTASPADQTKSWWLVTLTLMEGIVLQHVLPFETSEEAVNLVKLIAQTGTYQTDEFFDATEDMKSVLIDSSEEIEIDQDGKPRLHS